MKTIIPVIALILFAQISLSQTVLIDDTQQANQLIETLVGDTCAVISNANISSNESVAYFNANGSSFPISEGIILRSGIAKNTEGKYTGNNLDSQINTNSDVDLKAISEFNGQTAVITDVAFLEFDFQSLSKDFSFNFLFSSNEYGEFQCGFGDVFAFILTDLNTGEKVNLAVIPNTEIPISVGTIRDSAYNSACSSINSNLFSNYNFTDTESSTINMRGNTVVMNASAKVIPNNSYRIKLVIGDYADSNYDSAVFIEASNFVNKINLGEDFTLCDGASETLDLGFTNTTDYFFKWKKDGVVLNEENKSTLEINDAGTYSLEVTSNNASCVLTDEIVVTQLNVTPPKDLVACNLNDVGTFDLTENNSKFLNIDEVRYKVFYYNSLENLNTNTPINNNDLTNYSSNGNETIYIKIKDEVIGFICDNLYEFKLNTVVVVAEKPSDILACVNDVINIPVSVESEMLKGQIDNVFTFTYHKTIIDAENNTNAIANPSSYTNTSVAENQNIFVRKSNKFGCFDITDFNIEINNLPEVDTLPQVVTCLNYTLPNLTNGNYFTSSNGKGTALNAGDVITKSTTIYIFSDNGICTNQTNFKILIAEEITIEENVCGEFVVPDLEIYGNFYTAKNGPNGAGELLPTKTKIKENQTIYFYSEIEDVNCFDRELNIQVNELPEVIKMNDVVLCDSYTLPNLAEGNYFTGTNGTGKLLNPGDEIKATKTIYIYETNEKGCSNQSSFKVNIIDTSSLKDVDICNVYIIPKMAIGNYYTQTLGGGDLLPEGTEIKESQQIFFYTETIGNCVDNMPINITIYDLPEVDTLENFITCENNSVTLPNLTNGKYFTGPDGGGKQLNRGDIITKPQTIYIYNTNANCSNESSFFVDIRPAPPITTFLDMFRCEAYTLPKPEFGSYFTEPGGNGTQLFEGDIIETSQKVYIYNQYNDLLSCTSESFFYININGVKADELADVNACNSYTLAPLTDGNYFTEPLGKGTQLNAGDTILATQKLYIYNENGLRAFCDAQSEFTVFISETPTLPIFEDVIQCGFYDLPKLTIPDVTVNYYRKPNGEDLISPSDYSVTNIGNQTIYVIAFANANPNCAVTSQFNVTINENRTLIVNDAFICGSSSSSEITKSTVLTTGLNPYEFQVDWYLNGDLVYTGENFEPNQAGVFDVITTKLSPNDGQNCNYKPTQVEVKVSKPDPFVYFLNDAFSGAADIKIDFNTLGYGDYEFSLNNGPFQKSDVFLNVPIGNNNVTVRDISEICNDIVLEFKVMGYQKFFTPNNDGINDYWNISDLKDHPEAVISIYDRYGKLIANIKTTEQGWDGRNKNGTLLKQNDYWFKIEFTFQDKPVAFSGNLSLISD